MSVMCCLQPVLHDNVTEQEVVPSHFLACLPGSRALLLTLSVSFIPPLPVWLASHTSFFDAPAHVTLLICTHSLV